MKNFVLLLVALFLASASAFAPQLFGIQKQTQSVCFAKHVQDKAARWAASKRPKKSRPSDINRSAPVYQIHSIQKPAEFTISDAPATPVTKKEN